MADVIQAEGLVKNYGKVRALDGLDLSVPEGTVLGLLGPNGSGKTTAVSIFATLLQADQGRAEVAGYDVGADPVEVRKRIGLSGQFAAVDEVLTGYENLEMIGRLYRIPRRRARARARELLERFALAEAADRPVKTYSGGMRRRLDLAGSIIAEPPVLFLDEPTTGLDPRSRTDLWGVIRDLVGQGTTLLLTTQYLEEADQLADDILVIDHGRAIARGTAEQLKREVGGERIELTVSVDEDAAIAEDVLAPVSVGSVHVDGRTIIVPVRGGADVLRGALDRLTAARVHVHDIGLRLPTLDEVFLSITGHPAEDGDASADGAADGPAPGRGPERRPDGAEIPGADDAPRPVVAGDAAGDAKEVF
ncbi:MAG: ATP-binding cassette domain-containing protein [Acidimicrobiales bacterium]|nr:ATP-binding cassette domain-containing protein [Acidimicrobiales bacterium]